MNPQQSLRESSALPFVVFVLMFACAAGWALGPRGVTAAGGVAAAGRGQEKPKPTTEVYGRAVYEGTGRPVRRARLLLLGAEGGPTNYEGLTDGQGEFRIRGVAAGRYLAVLDVPGLVTPLSLLNVDDVRGGAPFDSPELAKHFDVVEVDGKAPREAKVTARRGAALAGRVTYADGSPAVGAQVYVLRRAGGRLERVITGARRPSTAGGRTDDRGAFRAVGLPPGEYVVGVAEAAAHGDSETSQVAEYEGESPLMHGATDQPFLMTFHPSAASADDATALTLGAGEEREDLDILIAERELRELTGSVRARRDGRPLAGATITIQRKGEAGAPSASEYTPYGSTRANTTKTDEHGRWRLKDIPDGSYTIHVKPADEYAPGDLGPQGSDNLALNMNSNMSIRPRRPKKRYAPAQRDVQVSAAASELTFEMNEGGRISGTITAEGGKPPRRGNSVYVVREDKGGERDYTHGSVDGGEFSFEGLPAGAYSVHYQSYSYEENITHAYVKSVMWEGKDLLRERVVLGEGSSVEGVRIILSTDVGRLRVRVSAGAQAARGIHVFLSSAGAEGWSHHAQQYHCMTADDGTCEIGAPPGEYAVVALPRAVNSLQAWEAEMKRLGPAAPRAAVRAGETKAVEVALPAPR